MTTDRPQISGELEMNWPEAFVLVGGMVCLVWWFKILTRVL